MIKNVFKKIGKIDIIIFIIVILIFGANLLGFYPGFLTPDSVAQLDQALDNNYTDAHPVLHSFIVGNLTNLFGGRVAAVGAFHIFVFALVWTYACHIIRGKQNTIRLNLFQIAFTIIICLLPINFVLSITVWKDILFSYSVLALLIYIYIGIKKKYEFSVFDIVMLSIISILVMKIRHNGLAISLIMIPLLMILNLKYTKKVINTIKFIIIFIICFIILSIPEWLCNVRKVAFEQDVFNSARLFCMGALLSEDIPVDEEDKEFLNKILPIDVWGESYNQFHAMNIFYNEQHNAEFLTENGKEFKKIFNKYASRYPSKVLKHFVYLNSITWSIPELGRMTTFTTDNSYIAEMANGKYQNDPKLVSANSFFGNIIIETTTDKTLYTLLYRPAIPMYISIIAILFLMIRNKKFGYSLLGFPMLLNIGVYLIMLPSQDLRYYYPSFLTCYFLIMVVIAEHEQKNCLNCKKIKGNNKDNNKGNKTLTIIPAYNESQNIQKVLDELKKDFKETDILVINDNSKDNTKEIVLNNNVDCITTVFNLRYAYAVQTGIKYAKKHDYDYCIMFDGDGQHIASEAKKLLGKIKESNCDIVIGSRYLEKGNYNAPKLRKIGTSFFTWLVKISAHKKISDPLSGFQIINKRVIDKYSRMGEYPEFPDANLIIEMLLEGYNIEEVSVKMRNREFGESMHGGIIKPIKYMIEMLYTIVIIILNKLGRRKKK